MRKALAVLTMAAALAAGPALRADGHVAQCQRREGQDTPAGRDHGAEEGLLRRRDRRGPDHRGAEKRAGRVRSGKVKTPASFRCPNVETPVQGLFYQSKPNFSGADEVTYETRNAEGGTETYSVKITVTDKPGGAGGGKKDGLLEL
jgi:hypothetical protein